MALASSYYVVAGVDLRAELERLRALPVFAAGELGGRRPELKIRRASRRPNRVGFAVPAEWRLSVTDYPGIGPGDAKETLLHELVHLHVGTERGRHRWHGHRFKQTLRRAMAEAYSIRGPQPRTVFHGAYAKAIEAESARRRARGVQLELQLDGDELARAA